MTPKAVKPKRRTREAVEQEYGQEKWPRFEAIIEEQIAADDLPRLDRVLARVSREQWRSAGPLDARPFVATGEKVRLPVAAAYGAGQGLVLEVVNRACSDMTDVIVELGSGWGWHILTLWTRGGPCRAKYVAAEFTEAGRRAAARVASLDPELDFQAVPFDYHEPAFPPLGVHEHAVVFSAHSVEQIPHVRPELFDAIRGLARRVTCLHFEPVGWQVPGRGQGTTEAYAEQHDYNRDLVAALRAEADAGRLEIDAIAPDLFGINADNATTVIRWRSEALA